MRDMRAASCITFACLAACASDWEPGGQTQYPWDGRRVLCSKVIDDLTSHGGLKLMGSELQYAIDHDSAALFHAHVPTASISVAQLLCLLDLIDRKDLETVTFADFAVPSPPRPAIALAFDDDVIDAWYLVRDLFTRANVRVTFFVTAYATWTPEQKAKLAELAALGHDVQPHSAMHYNAVDFVAEHGIDAYLQQEVLPSIAVLEQDGYPVTTYAFPGGATTPEITDAVLEHVPQVRLTRSACPY